MKILRRERHLLMKVLQNHIRRHDWRGADILWFTSEEVSRMLHSWEMKPLMWQPKSNPWRGGLSRRKFHFTSVWSCFNRGWDSIPISHEAPNNASTPEGLKLLFIALAVIPLPWMFIRQRAETHWWNQLHDKAWCVDISLIWRTRYGKYPHLQTWKEFLDLQWITGQSILPFEEIESDERIHHHQFRKKRDRWRWQWLSTAWRDLTMALTMIWMASAHWVNGINTWAKDIESFQMPKKPIEKTQSSSRLSPKWESVTLW